MLILPWFKRDKENHMYFSMKLPCWLLLCVKHGNICRNSSKTHPKFSLDPSHTFPTLDNLLWLLFRLYQHHDHGFFSRDLDVVPELAQEPLQPASPSRSTIRTATAQSGTAAAGAAGTVGAGSGARRRPRGSNGIHGPWLELIYM